MSNRIRLGLQGLRFLGPVGFYEEERAFPRPILVDLELEVDYDGSGDLSGTVDLEAVARAIKGLEKKEFRLLEDLATEIAQLAIDFFPRVYVARARVKKPLATSVPLNATLAEVVRSRDG